MSALPGVLMVTGAYAPEVTGASQQCRSLAGALSGHVRFSVLTTTRDATLPPRATVDGVPVRRIHVRPDRTAGLLRAAWQMAGPVLRLPRQFRVVHLHGFSRKSWWVIGLARARGRRVLVKLTSLGEDDPLTLRAAGGLGWYLFRGADAFVGVSTGLRQRHEAAGLEPQRFHLIPNGVDLERFRPAAAADRARWRGELGVDPDATVLLFVGHFAPDKRPDWLLEAWAALPAATRRRSALVLVGATRPGPHDVDEALADRVRDRARQLGPGVRFVETTSQIERLYGASDAFALPSTREGLPNALLEAMACGLPCVASRLPGITDDVVEDGRSGLLVAPDDRAALTAALEQLVSNGPRAAALGEAAREAVERRFGLREVAHRHLALYRELAAA